MKKNILKLAMLLMTLNILLQTSAFAAQVNVDSDLLPRPGDQLGKTFDELGVVSDLPEVSIEEAITVTIKTILAWSMLLALITIVFIGAYYLKSMGTEEDLSKAKNMIIYLAIGMAIMAAAYGVVVGISQFDFFK
ncbi:hypothetical protein HY604_00920 [Candidatus Peregrinibacteria bacterium]|nr:hypothetical protein [Candidatus Peregrinibacteria bacterium]